VTIEDPETWLAKSRGLRANSLSDGATQESYVLGHNVSARARMPLSIPSGVKISQVDLMSHMRNHYVSCLRIGTQRFDKTLVACRAALS
jgi:hypothetical protein